MKKLELVDDFDRIKKRWSVQIVKVGAAVFTAWGALAAVGLDHAVPRWVPQAVAAVGFIGAFLAAYVSQANLPPAPPQQPQERHD